MSAVALQATAAPSRCGTHRVEHSNADRGEILELRRVESPPARDQGSDHTHLGRSVPACDASLKQDRVGVDRGAEAGPVRRRVAQVVTAARAPAVAGIARRFPAEPERLGDILRERLEPGRASRGGLASVRHDQDVYVFGEPVDDRVPL